MTFPNFRRRSSVDEVLDRELNAWATGRHSELAEESPIGAKSSDALEFHRWADETLRSEPAATGPAAGTWNRVLRHVEQKSPRGTAGMSATTVDAARDAAIVYDSKPYNQNKMTLSRFANIAATVAIVFAVSVGGWFAMSQLPPGGEGRFGAFQASPEVAEGGTCDVEPLTVDEVMAIVENPYSVAPADTWGTPQPEEVEGSRLAGEGLMEAENSIRMPENLTEVPNDEEFIGIQAVADDYLTCLQFGTMGQIWALSHPETVQLDILARFPVYRDQVEIRAMVEETIDEPRFVPNDSQSLDVPPGYQTTFATTERVHVRTGDVQGPSLLADKVAFVGLVMKGENGEIVGATDWDATNLVGDAYSTGGYSMIMVYSEPMGTWYYYGMHAPRG